MRLTGNLGHLTYSTLVHPADTWAQLWDSVNRRVLQRHLGAVYDICHHVIEEALKVQKANPLSAHIEIETYTWDVLPKKFKTGDIVDYLVRELEWVRDQLL
jgi:hypothetical protein